MHQIIAKSWKGGHLRSTIAPDQMIELVQQKNACILFDGLDEVIVHMTPKLAQDFIRQLWRVLPPEVFRDKKDPQRSYGKLLISCRAHYFRTIQEQNTMLTGEQREDIRGEDYQALILLPFSDDQIESYLQRNLDGADIDQVIELIGSVHNLPEMAERPYTLSLIAEHIPQIEQKRLHGKPVYGVTLYDSMVQEWLMRDQGKHQFNPRHFGRRANVNGMLTNWTNGWTTSSTIIHAWRTPIKA